jgi:F0F1-type ATP synthase gamma subunit
VETVQLLPYLPSKKSETGGGAPSYDVIMESSQGDIVAYLVYIRMAQVLYEIFGFSRLAEFAARFVHLEESIQRLKDLDKKLRLQYFRARHELIDRNMRELFAARSLYAK